MLLLSGSHGALEQLRSSSGGYPIAALLFYFSFLFFLFSGCPVAAPLFPPEQQAQQSEKREAKKRLLQQLRLSQLQFFSFTQASLPCSLTASRFRIVLLVSVVSTSGGRGVVEHNDAAVVL